MCASSEIRCSLEVCHFTEESTCGDDSKTGTEAPDDTTKYTKDFVSKERRERNDHEDDNWYQPSCRQTRKVGSHISN